MRLKRKLRKGFTLVELVVVIAVIAILAAVSVGAYFGVTDSANSSNATAGAKQVKDLWMMYAISDYEDNKSLEDNAVDFCLRYMIENGPEYEVNYQVVGIKENQQISSQNGGSSTTKNGILFKIETQYPTWFLADGFKIVEQSEVYKNNEEFAASLHISNCIDTDSEGFKSLVEDEYNFEIEVLEYEGNSVRGFSFYDISIENSPNSNTQEGDHNFYIKSNSTIFDQTGLYLPTTTSLGSNVLGNTFKLVNETNEEISSQENIVLEQTKLVKITSDDPKYKYGYSIAEATYRYVQLNEINNENFPIAVVNYEFEISTSEKLNTSQIVEETNTETRVGTRKYTTAFAAKVKKRNIYYLQSEKFLKTFDFNDKVNFIYLSSVVINERIVFPDNTCLVIDCENTSTTSIENLEKKIDLFVRGVTNTIEVVENGVYEEQKILGIPTGRYDWSWSKGIYDASSLIIENEYIRDFNPAHIEEDYTNGTNSVSTKQTFTSDLDIKNKVIISEKAELKFGKNCGLIVDGKLNYATSNGVAQIAQRGELVNNGKISFESDSWIRAFSKISGIGSIDSGINTHVTEVAKFRDYYGGTNASNVANLKSLFPYLDLVLDNIQCNLNLEYGSDYSAVSGMYFAKYGIEMFYPTPEIFLISDDYNALFKYDSIKVDESHIDDIATKSYDFETDTIGIVLNNGNFYDGILNVSLSSNGITSGVNLSTADLPFPISNMDITITSGSTMNFQNSVNGKSSKYELLPSSSLTVEDGAVVNIYNGVEFAILNYSDFYKMHLDGVASPENTHQVALFKTFRELYESNGFAESENVINNGTINVGIRNNDNSINAGYLYSNSGIEIQIGETINPDETVTPIITSIQNRIIGNTPMILSENATDYLFNVYNAANTSNSGIISFAIKPVKINA